MVKYQQKVLVRLQTFNIYKNSGIIMTASGYNIYFYYFHRVENSMKILGECLSKWLFDHEFDHNKNLKQNLIDARKGL